jgi:hypothetical protein
MLINKRWPSPKRRVFAKHAKVLRQFYEAGGGLFYFTEATASERNAMNLHFLDLLDLSQQILERQLLTLPAPNDQVQEPSPPTGKKRWRRRYEREEELVICEPVHTSSQLESACLRRGPVPLGLIREISESCAR